MPKTELKSLFQRLRDHVPEGEASAQQQALINTIEYHIHDENEPDPAEPNLREAIELLIDDLEADHPQGAAVARNILETLANIGI